MFKTVKEKNTEEKNNRFTTNLLLEKYKYLFFDLFHTLTYPGLIEHTQYEWDIAGVSEEEWTFHSMKTSSGRAIGLIDDPRSIIEEIVSSIGLMINDDHLTQITEIRINRFKRCLIDISNNILYTIKELYERGLKLCIVSNADVIDIMGWPESPLSGYFKKAVFSCYAGVAKPDPEIYRIALNEMGANTENTLFIGDGGSNEFIGAKELKIDTLMTVEYIKNLWPERIPQIKKYADFTVNELGEMLR